MTPTWPESLRRRQMGSLVALRCLLYLLPALLQDVVSQELLLNVPLLPPLLRSPEQQQKIQVRNILTC